MSAEPRMEDLLASIKKAIHEDIGEIPPPVQASSSSASFKAAMHQMRIKTGEETSAASSEIQDLRNKISRNREHEGAARTAAPAFSALPVGTSGGHATGGLDVSGLEARLSQRTAAPGLRPSLAAADAWRSGNETVPGRADRSRSFERVADAPGEARIHSEPPILSGDSAAAAGAAFNRLTDSLVNRATGDRGIEDVTKDLLRQMLKQWLDDHLPQLVERLVREEIERVARRGR